MSRTYKKTPQTKSRLPKIIEEDEFVEPYYDDKSIFYVIFGVHRLSELSPSQVVAINNINKKSQRKKDRMIVNTHEGGIRRRHKITHKNHKNKCINKHKRANNNKHTYKK